MLKYKELSLDPNKENEQKKDLKKLAAKGKKITLVDIDWLVNKYGNTRIIRDFVNKFGLIKLDEPEDEKIDLFEDDEKIIQSKEEKKRA